MAWGTLNYRSKALNMPVEAEVLIPQAGYKSLKQDHGFKVMILLHGVRNDRTEWLLKSQIFDMVRELPVLVFMPSAKNSFYVNTYTGYNYMDFIAEEIPEFIRTHFSVSDNRKDWLIGGSSMGGYGALVCGLNHPEVFGSIASFSGAVDIAEVAANVPALKMDWLLGPECETLNGNRNNLFYIADQVDKGIRPRIYMCCGDEDILMPMNERFYEHIQGSYDVTASWGSGGHDFVFWNEQLKEVIKWFCPDEVKNGVFMGRCGSDLF